MSDPDYTQRSVTAAGSSGNTTRVYVHDRVVEVTGADTANHTVSGSTGMDADTYPPTYANANAYTHAN